MPSVDESIKVALKNYLNAQRYDVVEVLEYEQYTYEGGYCETCSYTETRVKVTFRDSKGRTADADIYSDFGELIRDLDKYSESDREPESESV